MENATATLRREDKTIGAFQNIDIQKISKCQPAMENKNATLRGEDQTIGAFQSIDKGMVGGREAVGV